MDQGYSILLGEQLPANSIIYGDCAPLQIVCPACREPVFKALREHASGSIHYLSHYRESQSFQANCELRVRSASQSDISSRNAQSRNQRLIFFLKRFSDLLQRDPFFTYGEAFGKAHREIVRAKTLRLLRKGIYEHVVREMPNILPKLNGLADTYIEDMTSFGDIPKTEFSMTIQKRIMTDMFLAVHTEPQRSNQAYLFGHSLFLLYSRFEKSASNKHGKNLDQFAQNFHSALGRLISGEEEDVQSAYLEMRNNTVSPPYVSEPTYAINFLAIEVTYEMVGALIRLPYFDLLKEFVESANLR